MIAECLEDIRNLCRDRPEDDMISEIDYKAFVPGAFKVAKRAAEDLIPETMLK
jgi:hypothetical protein